jgi:hypothetical protein
MHAAKSTTLNAFIILAFLSLSLTACKEYSEENKPVITLSDPTDEKEYETGDTIFIRGNATDNHVLHEMDIKLIKSETGETVFHQAPIVHGMESYAIDFFYIPADTAHFHFQLKIEVSDHNANTSELDYILHWAD